MLEGAINPFTAVLLRAGVYDLYDTGSSRDRDWERAESTLAGVSTWSSGVERFFLKDSAAPRLRDIERRCDAFRAPGGGRSLDTATYSDPASLSCGETSSESVTSILSRLFMTVLEECEESATDTGRGLGLLLPVARIV